jgi:hypothetical protein
MTVSVRELMSFCTMTSLTTLWLALNECVVELGATMTAAVIYRGGREEVREEERHMRAGHV